MFNTNDHASFAPIFESCLIYWTETIFQLRGCRNFESDMKQVNKIFNSAVNDHLLVLSLCRFFLVQVLINFWLFTLNHT